MKQIIKIFFLPIVFFCVIFSTVNAQMLIEITDGSASASADELFGLWVKLSPAKDINIDNMSIEKFDDYLKNNKQEFNIVREKNEPIQYIRYHKCGDDGDKNCITRTVRGGLKSYDIRYVRYDNVTGVYTIDVYKRDYPFYAKYLGSNLAIWKIADMPFLSVEESQSANYELENFNDKPSSLIVDGEFFTTIYDNATYTFTAETRINEDQKIMYFRLITYTQNKNNKYKTDTNLYDKWLDIHIIEVKPDKKNKFGSIELYSLEKDKKNNIIPYKKGDKMTARIINKFGKFYLTDISEDVFKLFKKYQNLPPIKEIEIIRPSKMIIKPL